MKLLSEDMDKLGMTHIYSHLHRGGYGYITYHPCKIIKSTKKRITIAVRKNDGTWREVNVKSENVIER